MTMMNFIRDQVWNLMGRNFPIELRSMACFEKINFTKAALAALFEIRSANRLSMILIAQLDTFRFYSLNLCNQLASTQSANGSWQKTNARISIKTLNCCRWFFTLANDRKSNHFTWPFYDRFLATNLLTFTPRITLTNIRMYASKRGR